MKDFDKKDKMPKLFFLSKKLVLVFSNSKGAIIFLKFRKDAEYSL